MTSVKSRFLVTLHTVHYSRMQSRCEHGCQF